MSDGRQMISYDTPAGRFNFRAAAIILREGHVLVTRGVRETVWYLPGGRVEWGESTREAVEREIVEELGTQGEIGDLAIVLENFFALDGQRWHELAYYFSASLPESFPFRVDGEVCHRSLDGVGEIEFKWVRAEAEMLRASNFRPDALCDLISATSSPVRHLVWSE
ncbi:MAG: mutT [Devosia sp.]|uniref:NUDIX hydrolase n=1 Tax=Devosia sp. TaxID=1871048 RepID=UPI00261FDC05|nr:NUDIX domain-containing protein [Devosia sp.]MDB5539823.1 mutT [Devosia sp.]